MCNNSNVGGVGIYVKKTLTCQQLHSISIPSNIDQMVENLWLEISTESFTYIVAGIYRHPNQNIADFTPKLEHCLELVKKKKVPCIIAGDINIDLSNYSKNTATNNYVDNLLIHNFMPTIVMPTRITSNTATIVDHIYYYEGRNCKKETIIKSGNFWNDMTDHLPNFFLIVNERKKIKYLDTKFIRLYSEKNIQKFKSAVNNIDWEPLYNYDNANSAYQFFQDSVIHCFNESFPLTRLSRKKAKDKKWITAGLKTSSKHKNSLYKKMATN